MPSGGLDDDVAVIGSGFGSGVTAMRAVEKGYGLIMGAGRRWSEEHLSQTRWGIRKLVWQSGAELYGIQWTKVLDDVFLCGEAAGGGGSRVAVGLKHGWGMILALEAGGDA